MRISFNGTDIELFASIDITVAGKDGIYNLFIWGIKAGEENGDYIAEFTDTYTQEEAERIAKETAKKWLVNGYADLSEYNNIEIY